MIQMGKCIPHKCKSTTFSGEPISRNVNVADFPTAFKHATQIFWCSSIRKIIHFQGYHSINTGRRPTVTHFSAFSNKLLVKNSTI